MANADSAAQVAGGEADPGVQDMSAGADPQNDMFAQFSQMFGGKMPGAPDAVDAAEGETGAPDAEGAAEDAAEAVDPKAAFSPEAIAQLVAADPVKGAETLRLLMDKYKENVIAEAQSLADGHAKHRDAVDAYFKDNPDMEDSRDLLAILAKEEAKSGKHKDVKALVAAAGANARKLLGKKAQGPVLPGAGPTGTNGAKPGGGQDELVADFEKRLSGR